MKIKIILFIFLLLILFINNLFIKEKFYQSSFHNTYNEMVDDKLGKILREYEKNTSYTLTPESALITLFYDRYEPYSRYYYDDTELDEISDDVFATSGSNDANAKSIARDLMKSQFTRQKENIKKMNVWNQFRELFKKSKNNNNTNHKYHKFLFMLDMEEVKCQDGNMPNCVGFDKLSNNIIFDASTSKLKRDTISKRQPPRPRDIVNKLPKVIFSFVKHIKEGNEIKYKQVIVEYEGIYNYNDAFSKEGLENLLDFVENCFEKHLNISNLQEFKNSDETEPEQFHKNKLDTSSVTYFDSNSLTINNEYDNKNIQKCDKSPYYYNL